MPPNVTVGELRDWFSLSKSRRLALIADDGRYVGALTPGDLPSGAPADVRALDFARSRVAVTPDMPAPAGRDLAIASDARRLPVVDADGRLLGVLAVTSDVQYFACRPPGAPR